MTLIDCVAVSTASNPLASQEFRHGWARLRSLFSGTTLWLETPEEGAQAVQQALVDCTAARALPDNARVLLLAHGHLLLTHGVLARLSEVLDADSGISSVHAFDSTHPPPQTPDYCTLRGMERYVDALDRTAPENLSDDGSRPALVTLTTLGAVRTGQVLARAHWVSKAYVHDFSDYHGGRREEVLALMAPGTCRLLDVGGGEGGFLDAAKGVFGCETHLAEYSPEACIKASRHVDQVWEGDFLTQPFMGLENRGTSAFDCITFIDVLEHAIDPQKWLQRARELLTPGGSVVASIPNVGHWGVIADLLEGRWDYCPVGIHCVTHVRFFTEHTLRDLFLDSGFAVERLDYVKVPCPAPWAAHWAQTPGLEVQAAGWDTYAFLVRAHPIPGWAAP